MDQKGEIFRLENGDISPYGPGHGDFAPALRQSGALQKFLAGGGKYLLVKNVDNVGARIDPAILGHHIAAGVDATFEVAPKWPGDVGGSPTLRGPHAARRAGALPRWLRSQHRRRLQHQHRDVTAASLDRDFDLGWYFVEKKVEDRPAVQIEHLIGELTAHLPTSFLQVRRNGRDTRFLPIKTPDDLDAARDEIREMFDGPADDDA